MAKVIDEYVHPFIKFIEEDKSNYKTAKEGGYIDTDNDFLIGESGGFLCNMSFKFINTYLFKEVGNRFEETGIYIDAEIDSPMYVAFHDREEHRRKFGMSMPCKLMINGTIEDLHITGEMYNFINYGTMEVADLTSIVTGSSMINTKIGIARFFDSHYWRTKINEFSFVNGMNLIIGKSRRAGWSYGEAIDTANTANLYSNSTTILAAFALNYLTTLEGAICPMIRDQLNFYEEKTPFNRCGHTPKGEFVGLPSKSIDNMVVGYKTTSGIIKGKNSKIMAVSYAGNPNVARGKGAKYVKLEEMSNAVNVGEFLIATEATIRVGQFTRGQIRAWGTAGSKEGSWIEFEQWFNNPTIYNAMPFENIWDEGKRHVTCGYFKPYMQSLEGIYKDKFVMDKDGNTDYRNAYALSMLDRKNKWEQTKSKKEYLGYCAEYANHPGEAFVTGNDNIFNSPELIDHISNIKSNPDLNFYRDGMLYYEKNGLNFISNPKAIIMNKGLHIDNQYAIHHYIEEYPMTTIKDYHSCIREYYPPYKIDGVIPKGLYVIDFDPFAIGLTNKELTNRHSLAAIRVRIVNNNIIPGMSDRIVATYAGRPKSTYEASKLAFMLSEYYGNAEILAEVDRGTVVQDAKTMKKLHLLAREPIIAWDNKVKDKSINNKYGIVIGNSDKKYDGIQMIFESLYKVIGVDENGNPILGLHQELDLPYLLELQKYDDKRNADRVSAAIVGEYHRKDLMLRNHKVKEKSKDSSKTIFDNMRGWYGGTNNRTVNINEL